MKKTIRFVLTGLIATILFLTVSNVSAYAQLFIEHNYEGDLYTRPNLAETPQGQIIPNLGKKTLPTLTVKIRKGMLDYGDIRLVAHVDSSVQLIVRDSQYPYNYYNIANPNLPYRQSTPLSNTDITVFIVASEPGFYKIVFEIVDANDEDHFIAVMSDSLFVVPGLVTLPDDTEHTAPKTG